MSAEIHSNPVRIQTLCDRNAGGKKLSEAVITLRSELLSFYLSAQKPAVDHDLLLHEVSRSHDTLQSVGLLWTSDQLVAST
jgi:hypothetical protein